MYRMWNIKLYTSESVPPQGKGVEAKRPPAASLLSGQNTHLKTFHQISSFYSSCPEGLPNGCGFCDKFSRPANPWVWKKRQRIANLEILLPNSFWSIMALHQEYLRQTCWCKTYRIHIKSRISGLGFRFKKTYLFPQRLSFYICSNSEKTNNKVPK